MCLHFRRPGGQCSWEQKDFKTATAQRTQRTAINNITYLHLLYKELLRITSEESSHHAFHWLQRSSEFTLDRTAVLPDGQHTNLH